MREAATQRVADLVRASGAQLGAVFDPDGERLMLIDDEGDVLTHTEATLVLRASSSATTCSATASPCP